MPVSLDVSFFLLAVKTEHFKFYNVTTWKLDFQHTGLVDGTSCVLLFSCLVTFLNYFCQVYTWSCVVTHVYVVLAW